MVTNTIEIGTARRPLRRVTRAALSGIRQGISVCAFAALLPLVVGVTTAYAQTTAVCSNTPTPSQRVECTEDSTSTDGININAVGVDIDTTAASEPGIQASHAGDAKIEINLTSRADNQGQVTQSAIDTTGAGSPGIQATHAGTGDVVIYTELGKIATTGNGSHGINVGHTGETGDVVINGITTIETSGHSAHGINVDTDATGRLDFEIGGRNITATGATSHGVYLRHDSTGAMDLDVVRDTRIRTTGYGVGAQHFGAGSVTVKFEEGVDIETSGASGDGILSERQGAADNTIKVVGIPGAKTITTSGQDASGIRGRNTSTGEGSLDITVSPSLTKERTIWGILPSFWPKSTRKLLILGRRS